MYILSAIKKSFLSFGKILIIALLMIIPVAVLETFYPEATSHLETIISQHRLACTLFRWALLMTGFGILTLIFFDIGQSPTVVRRGKNLQV